VNNSEALAEHLYKLKFAVVSLAVVAIFGCGGEGAATITGRATYRTQPLAGGTVMFHPQNGHPVSVGIDASGNYTAELPPGEYRVAITAAGVQVPPGWKEGDPSPPPPKLVLPAEYSQRTRTVLSLTVPPGGKPQTADFLLK
jgi:hypothetical protein